MSMLFDSDAQLPYQARQLAGQLPAGTPGDPTRLGDGATLPVQLTTVAGAYERKAAEVESSWLGFSDAAELDHIGMVLTALISRARNILQKPPPKDTLAKLADTASGVGESIAGAVKAPFNVIAAVGDTAQGAAKTTTYLLWGIGAVLVLGAGFLLFRVISTGKYAGHGVRVG